MKGYAAFLLIVLSLAFANFGTAGLVFVIYVFDGV
jgi:hypothetical protein